MNAPTNNLHASLGGGDSEVSRPPSRGSSLPDSDYRDILEREPRVVLERDVDMEEPSSGSPSPVLRSRTNSRSAPKRSHSCSGLPSSDEEERKKATMGTGHPKKKGRGRPVTHPEHEGQFTAEKRAERARQKQDRKDLADLLRVEDPKVPATDTRRLIQSREREERYLAEFRNAPSCVIAAQMEEAIGAVRKVAQVSRHLKGELVGRLYDSSAILSAGGMALARRAMRERDAEEEISDAETLRVELAALRRRNEELARSLEEERKRWESIRPLTSDVIPPPPSPADAGEALEVEEVPPPPPWAIATGEERDRHPPMRPSIRGISVRLPSPTPREGEPAEAPSMLEAVRTCVAALVPEILRGLGVVPRPEGTPASGDAAGAPSLTPADPRKP